MVFAGERWALGELISFISYIMQILMSVMMISMVVVMSARAEASAKRVVEVLDTELDIIGHAHRRQHPAMHRRARSNSDEVSFKYDLSGSGENVLIGISFTAQPGQVVGIVGGTGTGKTTLVHLIPRLYDVSAGAVLVDEVDVRDYPLETLREQIGVVLQQNTLFSAPSAKTCCGASQMPPRQSLKRPAGSPRRMISSCSFPDGYDTELGQGGVNLSGGQKQRLCIARAMLKKPKILILDDSTSAVDSTTEAKIRQAFYQNLADTTVFIIAQRISSVRDADQIIVLDDGKIAGMGTHDELLASNPIYQEINASQQEGVLAQWMRSANLLPTLRPSAARPPGGAPGPGGGPHGMAFERPKEPAQTTLRLLSYLQHKKLALVVGSRADADQHRQHAGGQLLPQAADQ